MQPWIESLHQQHHHGLRKKLRRSSHISYYSNTSATHQILLGGDIKTNPGPISTTNSGLTPTNNKHNSKKAATKCKAPISLICEKTVHINSTRTIYTYCKLLTNLYHTNTKTLTISNTENMKDWICFSCASIELLFHKVKNELSSNIKSDANYTNEHLEKLDELKKHLGLCHLNTQSMSSTFDKFQFMIGLMLLHYQKHSPIQYNH